ncbi:MAG TPA: hypothetical protein VK179_02805 [Bacteroidales bacterium]|nr:hypothetical protein [Bacteroidales bacterium]
MYTKVIGKLAGTGPKPESAENLTGRILANLPDRKNNLSFLKGGRSSEILVIFRMVTSTAAMFLIIFFIWQQRHIESKLARLEKQVASGNILNTADAVSIKAGYEYSGIVSGGTDSLLKNLLIPRRSLNYLLGRIKSLEDENKSLQQRFLEANQIEIKN